MPANLPVSGRYRNSE